MTYILQTENQRREALRLGQSRGMDPRTCGTVQSSDLRLGAKPVPQYQTATVIIWSAPYQCVLLKGMTQGQICKWYMTPHPVGA